MPPQCSRTQFLGRQRKSVVATGGCAYAGVHSRAAHRSDAGADLRMSHLLAEITPMDRQQTSGPCTDDLRSYARAVALRFDVAGVATVRVRGRRQLRTPDGRDSLVMRERTIVVRP